MIDYIAEAITEAFGERCPDFAEGCACCEAWQQYNRLREALEPFAREAAEWTEYDDGENLVEGWPGSPVSNLCVGDLRRAARVISEREGQE